MDPDVRRNRDLLATNVDLKRGMEMLPAPLGHCRHASCRPTVLKACVLRREGIIRGDARVVLTTRDEDDETGEYRGHQDRRNEVDGDKALTSRMVGGEVALFLVTLSRSPSSSEPVGSPQC